ncbi:MAG: TraR/DksA family transcriptional regulator [Woeseia sp.]
MSLNNKAQAKLRQHLAARRAELDELLARIHSNITRGLDRDSKERAKELTDSDVVDALGNDAIEERALIDATLARLADGSYGICEACGDPIAAARMQAYPYASQCLDCASAAEREQRRA